jgi:RimJ/RimL family protein N-acetyltransferase
MTAKHQISIQPLSEAYLESIIRLHNDPITQRFSWLEDLHDAAANAQWVASEMKKGVLGIKALVLEEEARFVGLAGLRMREDLGSTIDLVYRILPEYRNQGCATAAAQLLINLAKNELKLKVIYGQVHSDNAASLRVLAKTGFQHQSIDGVWQLHQLHL